MHVQPWGAAALRSEPLTHPSAVRGPIYATPERKFQGFPPIDQAELLSLLWCWQNAAYEIVACLGTHVLLINTVLILWAETPREKVGRRLLDCFHRHSCFAEFLRLSKGSCLPFPSWCCSLLISESEPRCNKLKGFSTIYDWHFLGWPLIN